MGEPFLGARQVRPGLRRRQGPVRRPEGEVAAHAGGEVQHDIDIGVAHPLDDLAVERGIARRLPGLRIPHMDMEDRRAGPRRLDPGLGDLRRRHRHLVGPAGRVAGAGQRTGDKGFAAGGQRHGPVLPVVSARPPPANAAAVILPFPAVAPARAG